MSTIETKVRQIGIFVAFIACIYGANWATQHIGTPTSHGVRTIAVLPGCAASSAVLFVGISFTLRDMLQRLASWRWVVSAILLGAIASYAVTPSLALASGVTFLTSETADFLVYSRLRRRTVMGAIVASNTVGAVIDSALFLTLAFGIDAMRELFFCQAIGKVEWSLVLVPLAFLLHKKGPLGVRR